MEKMKIKIAQNIPVKGFSWRDSEEKFLKDKLKEYIDCEKWASVANIAFMLWEKELLSGNDQ